VQALVYEVPGWGAGELWLDDGLVVNHELPSAKPVRGSREPHPLTDRLLAWFAGSGDRFTDVELELDWCTPLQCDLVRELRKIPPGQTVTYGELAALAGRPKAPRAGGSICAENRFPIFVPCHRVVSANGLGGYGSLGVEYKRRLLDVDGAP
jgi:methylated-DNA-[protein]-cysteine S-methyltransferase